MRVSNIALRALNEYRRVSPFTYLGLRYYLLSEPTHKKRWAKLIATEILRRTNEAAYLEGHQYKQSGANGKLEFRTICFPCANEALAEAALLLACARAGGVFSPRDDVFSYLLAPPESKEGSFIPYFRYFAARQAAIGDVCRRRPNDIVVYADIKRFYPSVTYNRAKRAWREACDTAGMDLQWRETGEHLLRLQREHGTGLLVGPMFSHLVGNLVLLDLDRAMRRRFRQRYFRYVDDIALVIPIDAKRAALKFLRDLLKRKGLRLNRKKLHVVSAKEWCDSAPHQGANYGASDNQLSDRQWLRFVDQIKCYLMIKPDRASGLRDAFRREGIRIALPQYQYAIGKSEYVARFKQRLASRRFRNVISQLTVRGLVRHARSARIFYQREFDETWKEFGSASGLKRKWLLSQIKYLLGKLIFLASEDQLPVISKQLRYSLDLAEYQAMFEALARLDASRLVKYSGKFSAAAGQAMATMGRTIRCSPSRWSEGAVEGYSTLLLLGVKLHPKPAPRIRSRYQLRLLHGEYKARDWHSAPGAFFQELFALAGQSTLEAHRELMNSPIDPDERWVLFADELNGVSS